MSRLKWTELKVGDVIYKKYQEGIKYRTVKEINPDDAEGIHICIGENVWLADAELADWSRKEKYKNEKIKEKLKEKYLDEAIKEWENIPLFQRMSKDEFSFYDGYLTCAAKFENQKLN